jgi:hypothetical protein
MLEAFIEREQASLIANDIQVLVSELNAKTKQAAENGLQVEITVSGVLDVKGSALYYPEIRSRVVAEVG